MTSWYDQHLSLVSSNSFTSWLFFNASYEHFSRLSPMDSAVPLQSNVLNGILGFRLLGGDLEISLACYDILGNGDMFKTVRKDNYIQTAVNATYGRVAIVNVIYRFNSTRHGGKKISFGYGTPVIGRRYEAAKEFDARY